MMKTACIMMIFLIMAGAGVAQESYFISSVSEFISSVDTKLYPGYTPCAIVRGGADAFGRDISSLDLSTLDDDNEDGEAELYALETACSRDGKSIIMCIADSDTDRDGRITELDTPSMGVPGEGDFPEGRDYSGRCYDYYNEICTMKSGTFTVSYLDATGQRREKTVTDSTAVCECDPSRIINPSTHSTYKANREQREGLKNYAEELREQGTFPDSCPSFCEIEKGGQTILFTAGTYICAGDIYFCGLGEKKAAVPKIYQDCEEGCRYTRSGSDVGLPDTYKYGIPQGSEVLVRCKDPEPPAPPPSEPPVTPPPRPPPPPPPPEPEPDPVLPSRKSCAQTSFFGYPAGKDKNGNDLFPVGPNDQCPDHMVGYGRGGYYDGDGDGKPDQDQAGNYILQKCCGDENKDMTVECKQGRMNYGFCDNAYTTCGTYSDGTICYCCP